MTDATIPAAAPVPCPLCDAARLQADAKDPVDAIAMVFALGLHLGHYSRDLAYVREIMCTNHRTAHTLASLRVVQSLEALR